MKKFMIICLDDEGCTQVLFRDTYEEAESVRMDLEVILGLYCEVYERQETEYGNEYIMM